MGLLAGGLSTVGGTCLASLTGAQSIRTKANGFSIFLAGVGINHSGLAIVTPIATNVTIEGKIPIIVGSSVSQHNLLDTLEKPLHSSPLSVATTSISNVYIG